MAGPLPKKELPLEGYCCRNGKRERKFEAEEKSDDKQHYSLLNALYEDTKMKAQERVE